MGGRRWWWWRGGSGCGRGEAVGPVVPNLELLIDEAQARIAEGSSADLERGLDRVVTARSLEAVFADCGAGSKIAHATAPR